MLEFIFFDADVSKAASNCGVSLGSDGEALIWKAEPSLGADANTFADPAIPPPASETADK